MNGIVYLTGAGPGDYRLLTLKGRASSKRLTSSSTTIWPMNVSSTSPGLMRKKYTSAKKPPTTPFLKKASLPYSSKRPVPATSSSVSKGATPSSSAAAVKKVVPCTTLAFLLKSSPV